MDKVNKPFIVGLITALGIAAFALGIYLVSSGSDDLAISSSSSTEAVQEPTEVESDSNSVGSATSLPSPVEDSEPKSLSQAENLALIEGNFATRNSIFEQNRFKDVPIVDIAVGDLTQAGDIYGETLIASQRDAYFRTECEVSHFAYDDPIVFPNQPGTGHLHMFFGNTKANAYSTFDSLLNTGTGSCNGEDLNRTAYWIPALLNSDGDALIPWELMVYYKNTNFALNGANHVSATYPDNLRMITGNGRSTEPQTSLTGPGSAPIVGFVCAEAYGASDNQYQATIPDCVDDGSFNHSLEMKISFPACWNGDSTYESDMSHVAYPVGGFWLADCPASHPIKLPSIQYRIFFRTSDYGGSLTGLHLSSDVRDGELLPGGTTLHADWFGAWHPDAMDQWVRNCNNTPGNDCEIGLLSRDPAVSMVEKKTGFYEAGKLIKAEDLAKLCPGKTLDPQNPVVSLSHCGHN